MADDIYVLGAANLKQRTRTNAKGVSKSRYTVEVSGDSLLINTDPKSLGKGPAEAIAEHLRQQIQNISAVASPGTLKWRKSAERGLTNNAEHRELSKTAFAKKEAAAGRGHLLGPTGNWAQRRYSGGRLGFMPPNQSDRLFNDSGRFAKSITANANNETWTINVASNRLDPGTLGGGGGALVRVYRRLIELVPEFGDMSRLLNSSKVRAALEQGFREAIQKADEKTVELKHQRMRAWISVVKQFLSAAA